MAYYKGNGLKEINVLEGDIKLRTPNFSIVPQKSVRLEGIGTALTGLYYIEATSISVTQDGVEQTVSVSRNGFTDTVKMNNAKAPTNKSPAKSPKKQTKQPANKVAKSYSVKKGDNLWNIAKKYYGKGSLWTKIYKANKSKIKNPNLIYPGQKFTIPK
nr:MAG TPA: tail assembly protein [Caudoviricetes sp.]